MSQEPNHFNKQQIFDWVPLILIIVGVILTWIGLDIHSWIMYLGFLAYGLLGLIELFNNEMKLKAFFKILKIITLGFILIIAILSIVGEPKYFIVLISLTLLDRILLTYERFAID